MARDRQSKKGSAAGGEVDLNALFQRARQAHAQGQFEEAELRYRQILSADPRQATVLHLLAALHAQTGRLTTAVKLARESIKIGGPVFEFLLFLGTVLVKAGDRVAGRHVLISALDSQTADLKALAALGLELLENGAPEHAEDCFRKVLAKNPDVAQVHNALGGLLLMRGELQDALVEFDTALRLSAGMVTAAFNRKEVLRRLGRLPDPCSPLPVGDLVRDLRCAVVTPVGPGHGGLAKSCEKSVARAFETNPGLFAQVWHERIEDQQGSLGRSVARNLGIKRAAEKNADFVFFLDADDLMSPHAFLAVAPYLRDYDAVWGLISSFHERVESAVLRADQVWCTRSFADILLSAPVLTLQMGHFVRTSLALQHAFDEKLDTGEDFDFYLRIWNVARCIKLPEVLFFNRRGQHSKGPRSATGGQWLRAADARIAREFAQRTVPVQFEYDLRTVSFHVKDPQDLIQKHHIAGSFFEAGELDFLRKRIGNGARIVDVGANVGNHAVFFGLFMEPASLLVVEPNPEAIELLRKNLDANGLHAVDCSRLGMGVGKGRGRFSLMYRQDHNLGAVALTPVPDGGIEVVPLDELVLDPVDFIKIDVENMELQVLEGARQMLARHKPTVLIEVMNPNLEAFKLFVNEIGYAIEREFKYVNAINFLITPR